MTNNWETDVTDVTDGTEKSVFQAIGDPKFGFKTILALSRETGLGEEKVHEILNKYPNYVNKYLSPDKSGRELYSLNVESESVIVEMYKWKPRFLIKKEFWQGFQAFLACIAIIAGGIWFYKQKLSDEKLSINHEVKSFQLDDERILVHSEIMLKNEGLVSIYINNATVYIQKIKPLENKYINALQSGNSIISDTTYRVPWPRISDRYENNPQAKILPNESDILVYEFIIPCNIELIQLYSYFPNGAGSEIGWKKISIHKIAPEISCN